MKLGEGQRTFVILSLKWTRGDDIVWWAPDNAGYTRDLGAAGRYTEAQVADAPDYYNDGESTLAVPVEVAEARARKVVRVDDLHAICTKARAATRTPRDLEKMDGRRP